MKGTFLSLNTEAEIYRQIKSQQPLWWNLFRGDKELYIEIRKDNYINIYYAGGSVSKISYKNDFVAETHQKYLGNDIPVGKSKKGAERFNYEQIDLTKLDREVIANIKSRIISDYSNNIKKECPSEKWIQGCLIKGNVNYLDSEFQFNQDAEIGKLRIDLIEITEGVLSFIELKGISDNRLRNDVRRNEKVPEIIEQMNKYKRFIEKYEVEIIDYYKKLVEIKHDLGLMSFSNKKFKLNKTPKLIIANTYTKTTKNRDLRIVDIKNLLETNCIDYKIIDWK